MTSKRIGSVGSTMRRRVTTAEVAEFERLIAEGHTQREIAILTGRGRSSVGDYLTGKRRVKPPRDVKKPETRCVECDVWVAWSKAGPGRKLRKCPKHGGD